MWGTSSHLVKSLSVLGLSNSCNGHLEPGNPCRQLRPLTSRWIGREPAEPFLVHAGEVIFVCQDNSDTHDLVEGAAGLLQDGSDVGQTLTSLLLNRGALDLPVGGIMGSCAGNEDQSGCLDCLAVSGRRLGRLGCE